MDITIREIPHAMVITLNRPEKGNSINQTLLLEINNALDHYENNNAYTAIILESSGNVFCAGMDFNSVFSAGAVSHEWIELYLKTLKRFTENSKIMIAKTNGKVLAGGVGLVAACDIVFASSQTSFSLPEVLWGLLPANVLPFLIRRIGFQHAYFMTLSHETISATEAHRIRLIDYLTENLDADIQRTLLRLSRLDAHTINAMKNYFKKLWIINDEMEKLAVNTLADLIKSPLVEQNIQNFLVNKKLPWEKNS